MRRRAFLLGSAAVVGGLAIGYRAWGSSFERAAVRAVEGDGEHLLAGWVKIAGDDTVTVYIPHVDMGQGTHTALAMMLAEELDADWSKVRTERAPGEKPFANSALARGWILRNGPQVPRLLEGAADMVFADAARFTDLQLTGGSTAVRFTGRVGMRGAGAAARAMLVQAAADRWSVEAAQLTVRDGVISDPASGRAARFGELAEAASRLPVPSDPPLKQPNVWRIVGTSPPRLDIPSKTDGSFAYGIDLLLPGTIHAAVRSAPVHGSRLESVDPAPAMAMPGVVRVLELDDAVAVVAASWWQAKRALDVLEPVFSVPEGVLPSGAEIEAKQDRLLASDPSASLVDIGNAAGVVDAGGASVIEASYRVPFLHQAAMEPIALTARSAEGRLDVWGGEQDALGTKARLAELSGLDPDHVTFHGLAAGGSFGRRVPPSADYLGRLVSIALSLAPDPVKLILSREEEFAQGAYRPALATTIRAVLGEDGRPLAWWQAFLSAPTRNEAFALPYEIPNQSIQSIDFATHIRTGTWRAVAHTQHAFWTESFVDELAYAAGRDPFEYRRSLLPEGSRERRVLETAAERTGWAGPLPAGHGRGIAIHEAYGTIVAHVVEASLRADGFPHVHRVVAAVDSGGLCHPDTARQQVEGAIVMGLSAAIYEKITLENGAVVQANFSDYPIMGLADVPEIEVHFLASDAPWGGMGEPGLPPAAPALANALFAATGKRIRRLPIKDSLAAEAS